MTILASLRQTPQPGPLLFLRACPGSWIRFVPAAERAVTDDLRPVATPTFDVEAARARQRQGYSITFTLQAFGKAISRPELLCFRNLGIDIDLVAPQEHAEVTPADIEARKEAYLRDRLLLFPLAFHWVTETRTGFHLVARVLPPHGAAAVKSALALNRRLARCLGGAVTAVRLTHAQHLPGTLQFDDGAPPFLCRLLLDKATTVVPHDLASIERLLDDLDGTNDTGPPEPVSPGPAPSDGDRPTSEAGAGTPDHPAQERPAESAAAVILGRLDLHLWQTAGWDGLRDWNARQPAPLPEPELRAVYLGGARREFLRRTVLRRAARDRTTASSPAAE